jgi:hypothetical protein
MRTLLQMLATLLVAGGLAMWASHSATSFLTLKTPLPPRLDPSVVSGAPWPARPRQVPPSTPLHQARFKEDQRVTLSCPAGQSIHIVNSSYGYPGRTPKNGPCKVDMRPLLRERCQSRPSCHLAETQHQNLPAPYNSDPCPGWDKDLEVQWRCVLSTCFRNPAAKECLGARTHRRRFSGNEQLNLTCKSGFGVDIVTATYGHRYRRCSFDPKKHLQALCQDSTCSFPLCCEWLGPDGLLECDAGVTRKDKVLDVTYACVPAEQCDATCHKACPPPPPPGALTSRYLILTVAMNYAEHEWCRFFASLRDAGYDGDVLVGTTERELNNERIQKITSVGPFRTILLKYDVGKDANPSMSSGRFRFFRKALASRSEYDDSPTIITDFRDVTFQVDQRTACRVCP